MINPYSHELLAAVERVPPRNCDTAEIIDEYQINNGVEISLESSDRERDGGQGQGETANNKNSNQSIMITKWKVCDTAGCLQRFQLACSKEYSGHCPLLEARSTIYPENKEDLF